MSDAPENAPYVQAEDITKVYAKDAGEVPVLTGLSLSVSAGQSMAVVGVSGIGKSTLLHILGTLDHPDAGALLLGGKNPFALSGPELSAFRNRTIGFVFQFHHLLPEFSALENAAIPARIGGHSRSEAEAMAARILERVGLSHRLTHRVGELSGGEQQRVAVARALVMEPRLLLADEPTGNLDKKTARGIHELLCELNEEKRMTMILVTHNPELAGMMSRQVTLVDGKAVEER
ncbi:MAG: ABC transporter ATP-binding protein [Deltaproteobacteria bacterium]|nr:ABC transporter ATP-binding protein [Deltaproteobacteria bacterium]